VIPQKGVVLLTWRHHANPLLGYKNNHNNNSTEHQIGLKLE